MTTAQLADHRFSEQLADHRFSEQLADHRFSEQLADHRFSEQLADHRFSEQLAVSPLGHSLRGSLFECADGAAHHSPYNTSIAEYSARKFSK